MGPQPDRSASARHTTCPGADCFELLGRRWNAYLVWALLAGPRRFTQLLTAAAGVSDRMLTKRLRELEAAGIVSRQRYNEVPPRVEYALTERGRALRPVIEAMERWGRATSHTGDPETAPP